MKTALVASILLLGVLAGARQNGKGVDCGCSSMRDTDKQAAVL
jgi:hypothetical protein